MRKSNEQSLGEIIKAWLGEQKINTKITEVRINAAWEKIMGADIHKLTDRLVYYNKKLTVYLRSAPLREELSMGKSWIIGKINAELGNDAVEEIIFR